MDQRDRIAELSSRWLPMLLNRIGVSHELTTLLRSDIEDDRDLLRRLELARRAVRAAGGGSREHSVWAKASGELISSLLRAHELAARNPKAAERIITRANQRLFSMLIGSPQPTSPAGWWSRLFSGVARTA